METWDEMERSLCAWIYWRERWLESLQVDRSEWLAGLKPCSDGKDPSWITAISGGHLGVS